MHISCYLGTTAESLFVAGRAPRLYNAALVDFWIIGDVAMSEPKEVISPISRKGSRVGSPNLGLSPGARSHPTARSRADMEGPQPPGPPVKASDQPTHVKVSRNSDKPEEVRGYKPEKC
jgi:hypothetical protein